MNQAFEFLRNPECRASLYNTAFPKRAPLAYGNGWVTGTWASGACYKNPNPLYGAYPHGYLDRVHSMFPDARKVLHVFSGGLTLEAAYEVWWKHAPSGTFNIFDGRIELVDSWGPNEGRHPTWRGDVLNMPVEWNGVFDLVLADPPYSAQDAEKYGTPMVNRGKVMHAIRRVTKPGGNLVWLDVQWPMHRKTEWKTWGHVGFVRSTQHRMRLVSFFEAV